MALLKCKMCGRDLEIQENETICVCKFCGTKQTVPNSVTIMGKYAFYGCKFANERIEKNVCVYCGGKFNDLFTKTCSICGRKKSY